MTNQATEKKTETSKKTEVKKAASPAVSATPVKSKTPKVETAEIITPKLFEGQEMFWKNKIHLNQKYGTVSGIILQHHWNAFKSTLDINGVKIKLTEWISDTDREQDRLDEAKAKMRRKIGLKD